MPCGPADQVICRMGTTRRNIMILVRDSGDMSFSFGVKSRGKFAGQRITPTPQSRINAFGARHIDRRMCRQPGALTSRIWRCRLAPFRCRQGRRLGQHIFGVVIAHQR